ncbi:hypothetical protein [Rubritalea marina]|uniref:hypothetical protein n=1 Tax=Rubritalea marina TaxID=361055 RepID=UPI00036AFEC6|nr:hypothetical protein [Rubritalea marina]
MKFKFVNPLIAVAAVSAIIPLSSCSDFANNGASALNGEGEGVEVLYALPVGKSYSEIGIVTVEQGQQKFSTRALIESLRDQAEEMGADAIIMHSAEHNRWGVENTRHAGLKDGVAEALAIQYLDEEAQALIEAAENGEFLEDDVLVTDAPEDAEVDTGEEASTEETIAENSSEKVAPSE